MEGKSEAPKISRRKLFSVGIGIAGVAIAGPQAYRQTPEGEQLSDRDVINAEVKRQNILPSDKEKELWKTVDFPPLPTSEYTPEIAQERFQKVFGAMYNSENIHYKKAAQLLADENKNGNLTIHFASEYFHEDNSPSDLKMAVSMEEKDSKIAWKLHVAGKSLAELTPIQIAQIITHEMAHLNEQHRHLSQLSSLSVEQQAASIHDLVSGDSYIQQEAIAYGVQGQAYVQEYGLWYKDGGGTLDEAIAANFIRAGQDFSDPRWLDAVENSIHIAGDNK